MLWLDKEIAEYIGHAAGNSCGPSTAVNGVSPANSLCQSGGGAVERDVLDRYIVSALCASVASLPQNSLFYKQHLAPYKEIVRYFAEHGRYASSLPKQRCVPGQKDHMELPSNSGCGLNCQAGNTRTCAVDARGGSENSQGFSLAGALSLLDKLPFTDPGDLAANPEAFLAVGHDEVSGLISVPSSGTTGSRKRVFCSAKDLQRTVRFFAHGMRFVLPSLTAGQRVMLLMSGERQGSVGQLLSEGLACWSIECDVYGFPTDMQTCRAYINASRPHCLVGLPSHIMALCRAGLDAETRAALKAVLLSGEWASPTVRSWLEEYLQCPVFLHYGLTESGLAGAVECQCRSGCHIREADILLTIVDRDGRRLPDGKWGEIVLTTLSRQATPLLRYKTGDRGRIMSGRCACGSYIKRVEAGERLECGITLPDGSPLGFARLDATLYPLPWLTGYDLAQLTDASGRPFLSIGLWSAGSLTSQRAQSCVSALSQIPGLKVTAAYTVSSDLVYEAPCCGSHVPPSGSVVFSGDAAGSASGDVSSGGLARTSGRRQDMKDRLPVVLIGMDINEATSPCASFEGKKSGNEVKNCSGITPCSDEDSQANQGGFYGMVNDNESSVMDFNAICLQSLAQAVRSPGKRTIRRIVPTAQPQGIF